MNRKSKRIFDRSSVNEKKVQANELKPQKRLCQSEHSVGRKRDGEYSFKFSWNEFESKVAENSKNSERSGKSTSSQDMVRHELIKSESKENINDSRDSDEEENMNYMQIRMMNMKDNQEFLASIGMHKAKESLAAKNKKTKTLSQRGLKMKKEPIELLPPRKSLRLSRIDPAGIPLPDPAVSVLQDVFEERLPEGPLKMKDCLYSAKEEISEESLEQFRSLLCRKSKQVEVSAKNKPSEVIVSELNKLSLSEERVAKVVPRRIFSLEWHPSNESLIAVAGDKDGHIGFWNVLKSEKDGCDIVTAFRPHTKPVSQLSFSLSDHQKLYSCSYDATLRCLDVEKCVFDEIFSVPREEDDLFRDFCFVDSSVMVVTRFSGTISVVDIRTPSKSAEHSLWVSKKSLHTIHVNPSSSNHFITAGGDATVSLWDLRSMMNLRKSAKPLLTLREHSKTVSSAYFSPDGQQILTCSVDDSILLFSCKNHKDIELCKRIRHNNHTGRWLTKFRPSWHPTVKDLFVSGSMAHPRRIELFTSTDGSRIADLESDYLNSVSSLNQFHPVQPWTLVGANSSGRLHVFM